MNLNTQMTSDLQVREIVLRRRCEIDSSKRFEKELKDVQKILKDRNDKPYYTTQY